MRLRLKYPLKVTILRNRLSSVGQRVQPRRFAENDREKALFSKRVRLVERERFYQVHVTPENFAQAPGASAVAGATAHQKPSLTLRGWGLAPESRPVAAPSGTNIPAHATCHSHFPGGSGRRI
jgi:hypothetical protein